MKTFLFVLCVCWGISIQAQQFNTSFSTPDGKVEDAESLHRYGKYIYSNKTHWGKMQLAYTANLKKVKYGVELTQYDEQLNELKTLSLDKGEKDFGPFSPLVHYGTNAIYIIYFKFAEEDKVKMYVSKVNPDDLSVITTKEIMAYDQKNEGFWRTVKTIEDTQIFYTVSEDGKNAWIVHASPTLIVSSVIDADLNLVQKTESTPVKLEKLMITGAHIANDGNKVLVYRYDNPQFREFFERGVFFQTANGKGLFKPIKFTNGYAPGNLELQLSKDGRKLYLAGEYFGEDYDKGGKGVLLGEVNIATQSVSTPAFYPYTDELRQRVLNLDFASKKKGEIIFTDHHLNYRITEMENGTIVLSADMHTSGSSTHATFFFTGPIVHVFIKPGGNTSMTLIPKKQASGSVTGFFNYVYKDKLICISADGPSQQEGEIDDKKVILIRTLTGMVPIATIYDSEGKFLSRKMLVNSKKEMKGNILIDERSKIEDNKFLFPVSESKVTMTRYYTRVNQVFYLEIL